MEKEKHFQVPWPALIILTIFELEEELANQSKSKTKYQLPT